MKNRYISALIVGVIFSIGIILSGMVNPQKVLAFLDITGDWDPSLGLVMAGAVAVGVFAFALAGRRKTSLLGEPMRLPTATQIDPALIIGSLGFGVGWGLAGFCPGPAIVALGAGQAKALVFVISMAAGMGIFEWQRQRAGRKA
ncbi:YeeE/YedE family protein [Parahaliea sp. F7430]|uniref:YeeE/YedE family protein n=1 Tax=Sediminihaliea albiluteola TaxID=2758564 RepID=A0A7W2TTY1_9GAMM|nr:YeeE/YedE family protein [Sediminihaliea albiluteola]MBA6411839.1 YeeE/YedE family protein [Sediminihaliea albiluteola]